MTFTFTMSSSGTKALGVKDTHREKSTLKLNSSAYGKYEYGHLGRWYIKLTLFKRF